MVEKFHKNDWSVNERMKLKDGEKNRFIKRRVSAMMIALAMIVAMLPIGPVYAAELTVGSSGTYATLAAALAAASDGDTIKLIGNVTETATYTFDTTIKNITIDGQGHTVTGRSDEDSFALSVEGSGTLTLKDITLQGGDVSIDNTYSVGLYTVMGSSVNVQCLGTVNVIGGDVPSGSGLSFGVYQGGSGNVNATNATGGDGLKSYGAYNYGTGTINTMTATGGTANSDSMGVYNANNGTVNVAIATGGTSVSRSFGVNNSSIGCVNVGSATGGTATSLSCGIQLSNGSVNVGTANGSAAIESYGVITKSPLATANCATATGLSGQTNCISGEINLSGTDVSTLTLNKGTSAYCVLDSITIAASGSTKVGTLPQVIKEGVVGTWYQDAEKTTLAGSPVTGLTNLYSTFYESGTMSASTLTDFEAQPTGYASAPASQMVTITNTGATTITLTEPAVTNPSTNYQIGNLSTATIASGATGTFTVQPKTGLAIGTYNETINIAGSGGATASVSAKFRVTRGTLDLTTMATTDNIATEGWAWDATTKVVTLSGINWSTVADTGMKLPTNAAIVLIGDNYIESTQSTGDYSYGIYAMNGLSISGSGTLTATGGAVDFIHYTRGIYIAAGTTTIDGGTITATGGTSSGEYGKSMGIFTYDSLTINGGTLNVIGGTSSGNYGKSFGLMCGKDITMNGGSLNVISGNANNDGESTGIYLVRRIYFNDGTTTITTNNASTRGAVHGLSGITLDSNQWISSPVGAGISADNKYIATVAGGTTAATSAVISPYTAPSISVNDPTVIEGNAGTVNLTYTVSLSAASGQTVTVNYATEDGTATTANSDYASTSGSFSFAPGETSKTVTVLVNGDTANEPDETVKLNLSSATNATILDAQGVGTITNDDVAIVQLNAASVTITAPVAGAAPQATSSIETATADGNYTVTDVFWNEALTASGKFKAGTTYTATITLTSKNTKEFQSAAFIPTVTGAATVGNTTTTGTGVGNTVSFTVTYAPTAPLSVSSIAVTTQPTKLSYMETSDDVLALNGMVVTATNNDGTTTTAIFTNGTAPGYTASPANGSTLTVAGNNGNGVTITETASGRSNTTANLTVVANSTKAIIGFAFNGLTPAVAGTINETNHTIAITVPYGTNVTALVPTITTTGISVTSGSGVAADFTNPATYTVAASDSSTQSYAVTVTIAANPSSGSGSGSGGSGGGSGGSGSASSGTGTTAATVGINGKSESSGTMETVKEGEKTVTTVMVDDATLQERLQKGSSKSTISILISGNSDVGQSVLNGQTVKEMEQKESILEIKTTGVTYSLPAADIDIDSVSDQMGKAVALKDIKISVKIEEPTADDVKIVENTADKNKYQIVVKPVEFEITASSGGKTVTVSKFKGYVERLVVIPEGIDPSKVTTGILLNSDGTFSHVPTVITKIDGKYYAKINSLTNSTYSVIYNPVSFTDVTNHWAEASINNMGSRLVISGTGNNNFDPNRDITRAEFAAIMVRALGLTPDAGKNTFDDVATTSWYSGYVGTAASYGIISGFDAETFAPNAKITREQAMTMVARAMAITELLEESGGSEASKLLAGYSDTSNISSYAKDSIAACLNAGIVTGKTAITIAPKNNITRAEVAVIVERLLKQSDLIS